MAAWSERRWLTWAPPVVLAAIVMLALQFGGEPSDADRDGGTVASGDQPTSQDSPSTTQVDGNAAASSTPTTGFADRQPVLPSEPFSYATELPEHLEVSSLRAPIHLPLSEFDDTPADSPITDEGATLGRVLFYDVNLSANRTVRCASCHVQAHSFTDPLVLSQGFSGIRTRRNSMSLANARFNASGRYLWDERAETLEIQMLMPFVDPLEMGLDDETLVARMEERAFYRELFANAFGDDTITVDRMVDALAQFVRAMVSVESRYDAARPAVSSPLDPFPDFSDLENEGKALFFSPIRGGGGGCSGCHSTEAQLNSPAGLSNTGLDPPTEEFMPPDLGAFEVTGDLADVGLFRVPSLRNIEVTAPYMHDGRLATLELVVEHYNSGIQNHENLSRRLRDGAGNPVRLGFDDEQKAALVAFLLTLTDDAFLSDERFAEPFLSSED